MSVHIYSNLGFHISVSYLSRGFTEFLLNGLNQLEKSLFKLITRNIMQTPS